jgi:hypothetical protein
MTIFVIFNKQKCPFLHFLKNSKVIALIWPFDMTYIMRGQPWDSRSAVKTYFWAVFDQSGIAKNLDFFWKKKQKKYPSNFRQNGYLIFILIMSLSKNASHCGNLIQEILFSCTLLCFSPVTRNDPLIIFNSVPNSQNHSLKIFGLPHFWSKGYFIKVMNMWLKLFPSVFWRAIDNNFSFRFRKRWEKKKFSPVFLTGEE